MEIHSGTEYRVSNSKSTNTTRWMVRCPGHPDRIPSLAVIIDTDGKLSLYCHAGCSLDRIMRGIKQRNKPERAWTDPRILFVLAGCVAVGFMFCDLLWMWWRR